MTGFLFLKDGHDVPVTQTVQSDQEEDSSNGASAAELGPPTPWGSLGAQAQGISPQHRQFGGTGEQGP